MSARRIVLAAAVAVAALFVVVHPAAAQWPTVVMFHGGELRQPVFITDADTAAFSRFIGGTSDPQAPTAKDQGARPYVNVACFWGPRDQPANNGIRMLAGLKPEMAWQHGRFFPASEGKPPMLFLMSMALMKNRGGRAIFSNNGTAPSGPVPTDLTLFNVGGEVPAATLEVLERAGVPTEIRPR